ncbi:MAG TPA: hypothetical protein V6C86_22970 [Oculatellaceae cyanobacterium]
MVVQMDLCPTGKLLSNFFGANNCHKTVDISSDAELRIAVADQINTTEEVLLLLAEDDNPDVRYAVAENHNISRKVLNLLVADSNPYVACRAQKTLARLAAETISVAGILTRCASTNALGSRLRGLVF